MQISKYFSLILILFLPSFLAAQSVIGDWLMESETPDGAVLTNKFTFTEDGILMIDFENNGTIDSQSNYEMNGNQLSIDDTNPESPCNGKIGVYEVIIEGNQATVNLINDPCDARRGDGKPGKMTRIE